MFRFLGICFGTLVRLFCSHKTLALENLALRQQLFVLKRRHPRPALDVLDRLFWLLLRRFWSGWKEAPDLEGCTIATIGLPDLIQVALRKLGRSFPSFI